MLLPLSGHAARTSSPRGSLFKQVALNRGRPMAPASEVA
jgi:hypothetical protein